VGGPGNSLDINYNTQLERTSMSLQRSNNSNVRSVNLFWRHDKPSINWKVRTVNLRLDLVQLGYSKSHIQVTSDRRLHDPWSVSTIIRQKEAYTSYC